MTKYHISKDGLPAVCKAKERPCPLGGASEHFSSLEAAEAYIQEKLEKEHGLFAKEVTPKYMLTREINRMLDVVGEYKTSWPFGYYDETFTIKKRQDGKLDVKIKLYSWGEYYPGSNTYDEVVTVEDFINFLDNRISEVNPKEMYHMDAKSFLQSFAENLKLVEFETTNEEHKKAFEVFDKDYLVNIDKELNEAEESLDWGSSEYDPSKLFNDIWDKQYLIKRIRDEMSGAMEFDAPRDFKERLIDVISSSLKYYDKPSLVDFGEHLKDLVEEM